jgi:predicted transcriptional regulator
MMAAHLAQPSDVSALENIRAAVARGKADVEAGRTIDAAEAFAELEAYFRVLARGDASAAISVGDAG